LEFFGTNYSPGKLIISGNAGGYGNTNYYFDGTRSIPLGDNMAGPAKDAVLQAGAPTNSVIFNSAVSDLGLSSHITNCTNVAGYVSWGYHSSLTPFYAVSNIVQFQGSSQWFIVATGESANGLRYFTGEGHYVDWFSENAFGQHAFGATAVGAVSQVDEPHQSGLANTTILFRDWHLRRRFGNSAWRAARTQYFQAIGDPLTTR
jgi:hypothetical protein